MGRWAPRGVTARGELVQAHEPLGPPVLRADAPFLFMAHGTRAGAGTRRIRDSGQARSAGAYPVAHAAGIDELVPEPLECREQRLSGNRGGPPCRGTNGGESQGALHPSPSAAFLTPGAGTDTPSAPAVSCRSVQMSRVATRRRLR